MKGKFVTKVGSIFVKIKNCFLQKRRFTIIHIFGLSIPLVAIFAGVLWVNSSKDIDNISAAAQVDSVMADYQLTKPEAEKIVAKIDEIKKTNPSWKPGVTDIAVKIMRDPSYFKSIKLPTFADIQELKKVALEVKAENTVKINKVGTAFPSTFNWHNHHGKNYMTLVKDQGACGSCWVFAPIAVIEGAANAYYNLPNSTLDLSEQDPLFCSGGGGCGGGQPRIAWDYIKSSGVVAESCRPYVGDGDKQCHTGPDRCPGKDVNEYLYKITNIGVFNNQDNTEKMKSTIMSYGPVMVYLTVYEDLYWYTGGIYEHKSGSVVGYHVVTIAGWGNEGGTEYYDIKNSWGTGWGEGGFFRYKISAFNSENTSSPALFAIQPILPQGNTPLCLDEDGDYYCAWGLGPKPANCPPCSGDIQDCNDSNPGLNVDCGVLPTPTLTPAPTPTVAPTPTSTPAPTPPPLPDLVLTGMTRDSSYYYVDYCNNGAGTSSSKFTINLKNTLTGASFESNYYYPYDVPGPTQCGRTGGFTCGLIGDPSCKGQITVEATIDWRKAVKESNEDNNTLTKSFIPAPTSTPVPTRTPSPKPTPTLTPTVRPTPKPTLTPIPGIDLVVTNIARDDYYYIADFCNRGTQRVSKLFSVYFENKAIKTSLESSFNSLLPSACQKAYANCGKMQGDPFWYLGIYKCNKSITLTVTADWRNTIKETNENNNTLTKSF